MSCGVGRRCGLDPAVLWLWHRLEATAPTGTLAWEPPYATGAALEKAKKKKKKKKKRKENDGEIILLNEKGIKQTMCIIC